MTNSWSGWASNDDPGRFPASVYAGGYLRTYASYLGLSAEDLVRPLPAGSVVWFTGVDVKIPSGKAWATFISIDGRNLGPMGVGVATRELSSQTSP